MDFYCSLWLPSSIMQHFQSSLMNKCLLFSTADESLMLGSLQKALNSKLRVFKSIENNYFSYGVFEYLVLWIHNVKRGTVVSIHL